MDTNPSLVEPKSTKSLTRGDWLPLVISNTIPLIGVLFFGWSIGHIIILYWIENLILGFWNIPRILLAGEYENKFRNLPLAIFFIVHYGIFCFVHGAFILFLISFSEKQSFLNTNGQSNIIDTVSSFVSLGLIIAIISMFLSIGWDLIKNYLLNGEHKKWKVSKAMAYPYGHIVVVHIAIFAGAFGAILLGAPLALLVALIVGKTLIELKAMKKRQITNSN